MSRNLTFGPNTTAAEVLSGIDLSGKRVLITGGSGGLGAATAQALAARGADVTITARDARKAEDVARAVKGNEPRVEHLELGSLASVRACAERYLAKPGALDILINNAAVMACPHEHTADGFERQLGTNHLGHFLLTNLLAPKLAHGARIVMLSSAAHHASPVVFDDLQFERRPYDKWQAYGQSKTANALFAVALSKRLAARAIEGFSVHPGMIVTELMRYQGEEGMALAQRLRDTGKMAFKTIEAGIATTLYAATAPELAGHGGAYLADCGIAPVSATERDFRYVRPYALDAAFAEQLWAVSEKLVGQRFA
ncbi:MAG TPA: SDR family NAD(P)-dependent oxidoreductase [Polyangiales bacterium]|nr:SDR family NAD(P)-dependent oxidoreductase [Polyangiales bacterium]